MILSIQLRLDVIDTATGKIVYSVSSNRSITYAGYEFLIRCAGDPTTRPTIANTIGIGWGPGANTEFNPNQTSLQGAYTSFKPATWSYNPATDRLRSYFSATWGSNDPSASLIWIGEIGLFSGSTLIDRTPITPTPKFPDQTIVASGVLGFTQAQSSFTLL